MKYQLPELGYDYSALEPHISAEIMELHHSKHHQAYVNGANEALEKLEIARRLDDFSTINLLEKNLAFNLAGHINHSFFWKNMTPGGQAISSDIAAAVTERFGSVAKLQAQFNHAALGLQGSGWAVLAWDQIGQQLITAQLYDHQNNLPIGIQPLLMLDMWEHAFYLQYKNVKADYVQAWWKVVDWENVEKNFQNALSVSRTLQAA